ncbi:hypothetical protein ACOSQ2_003003 [Xanthoceras sorbifolium]
MMFPVKSQMQNQFKTSSYERSNAHYAYHNNWHHHNQPLFSSTVNYHHHIPMFASQQPPFFQGPPPFSTPDLPITQNYFSGGGAVDQRVVGQQNVVFAPHPALTKRHKLPLSLFTDNIKPRLQWTQRLHDRFLQAMMELGGPDKATPKTLKHAMALDGLALHHVKSHLQKFRRGKTTMHNSRKAYKANRNGQNSAAGAIFCASTSSQEPSHMNGSNIKKTSSARKDSPGELFLQLQAAKRLQDLQVARRKVMEIVRGNIRGRLTNHDQYDIGMGSNHQNNVGRRMFGQDLSGFENQAIGSVTAPLYSAQQNPDFNLYNSLEEIKRFLGLDEQESSTVSAGHQQPEQVDVAANGGGFMTSTGYSDIPGAYNNSTSTTSAINNNVQVGLQHDQQPPSCFQNQNEVYNFQPANGDQPAQTTNGGDFGNFEPGNGYYCLENQIGDYSVQVPQQSATTFASTVEAQNANAAASSSCGVNSLPMSKEGYFETAYFDDDYNAALVATTVLTKVATKEEEEKEESLEDFMKMNLDIFELDIPDFCYDVTNTVGSSGQPS